MSPNGHCFVEWKEKFISQERGNRVVHYFLLDYAGNSILAVVGTERSVRHMFYVVAEEFLNASGSDENSAHARFKWKSRREAVEWLTSMLSKQHLPRYKSEMITVTPKRKVKANWDEKNVELFIDMCVAEVKAGNRPSTHFNKIGWKNIIENFSNSVGTLYVYKQLKNKWDMLKKEYTLWLRLIGKETGLGWDPHKKTVAASDEWWAKKLQELPEASKFRDQGLDNLPKLEFLFMGVNATIEGAWTPSSGQLSSGVIGAYEEPIFIKSENMMEGSGDSFNGPENFAPIYTPSARPTPRQTTQDKGKKRSSDRLGERKEKKRSGATVDLSRQIERMCEAVESRTTATSMLQEILQPRNTVEECVQLLDSITEIGRCSDLYLAALELFVKKEYRDIFMAINDNGVRVAWLSRFHS